jgi:hypothetical protein
MQEAFLEHKNPFLGFKLALILTNILTENFIIFYPDRDPAWKKIAGTGFGFFMKSLDPDSSGWV